MSIVENKENLMDNQNMSKQHANKRRMIGDYLLGKTQGEGTFGKVKSAVHQITQEKVAIKILEKERIVEVADVERVSREIHILKLIRHKHVIQLYEIIETPKHIFLVMEYADGGELFDYIVLTEVEACRFFQELISGIEYLHQLQIVHRDLKPENLLLDFNKSIKIIDFGLSNTYKKGEQLKTACGSPCYAAPEMIAGQKYDGLMVDIWSSGVILYAALCGCLPFEDQNTSHLYKKILNGDYTLPKFLTQDSQDFLKAILTTDPKKRITVEQMKQHPWFNIYKKEHKIPPGIIIGFNRIPIDEDIINQLVEKGFDADHTRKCLDANKHNNITTAYFLMLKRFTIKGGKSKADINNEEFDCSLLEPKKRPEKPPISGIVTSTLMQLNKKVRSGSCSQQQDPKSSGCISKPHEPPSHQRGKSVPHVHEVVDDKLLLAQMLLNQSKVIPKMTNQSSSITQQLQQFHSTLKEEQESENNKSFSMNAKNLNQFLKTMNQGKQKTSALQASKDSVSPSQKKKQQIQSYYPYNRSKKSVSIQQSSRPISTGKSQPQTTMNTSKRNNTSKNKQNNISLDQGYLEDKRKSYNKHLLDTTNVCTKSNQYKMMLNEIYNENFTSNTPITTTTQGTRQNQTGQNISISKLAQLCKRREVSANKNIQTQQKKNQSFTFEYRVT